MWNAKILLSLLLFVVLITKKTEANAAACEQKEKNLAALDFAKEAISKAKDLQPTCVNDSKNVSSNASECGVKERVAGYLDIATTLIEEAKKNYSACDESRNVTKVILIHPNPVDCSDVLKRGGNESGVYTIWPKHRILEGRPLEVYCDMDADGGGWTVIQRRGNFATKMDFYRNWFDYKYGFGNISEEFWIGNEYIFALSNQDNYIARFDMKTADKKYHYATYSTFWIDDENAGYMLHIGSYDGTAGDGMKTSNEIKFSTKDKKNDKATNPCTTLEKGGWWYNDCGRSNPNGLNVPGGKNDRKYMHWEPLTGTDALLEIEIKIREKTEI
ncbi:techylectin-5A-like [Argiope bruennichi]|uniref:techylectin-5A-like n=1 Tax=Argiope bruennichi TaxID=94029 RepID=UPI0024954150|nr:techylectin-5A-like [Argiope bruennichi]